MSSDESMTVTLTSGGTVTLTFSIDVWSISANDAAFVLAIARDIRRYQDEQRRPTPERSSAHVD